MVIVSSEFILLKHFLVHQYYSKHAFIYIVISSHFHMFLYCILIFLASHTTFIITILLITTTVCLFRHLDHTNKVVYQTRSSNFLHQCYLRFTINHTLLLCEVMRVNKVFSRMYCITVFALLPSNAFVMMTMLVGKFAGDVLVYIIFFLLVEFLIQIDTHSVLASYHKKLHQATPQLFSLSITHRKDFARNLRAHLDLERHISKFHTNNPYGITCGPFGLVTNRALIKVKANSVS